MIMLNRFEIATDFGVHMLDVDKASMILAKAMEPGNTVGTYPLFPKFSLPATLQLTELFFLPTV